MRYFVWSPVTHISAYSCPLFGRFVRPVAAGYGMLFVPSSPGSYDLDCVTWRPQGTLTDRLSGETTTLHALPPVPALSYVHDVL